MLSFEKLQSPSGPFLGGDIATVAELADMGVRRISLGRALARAAWTGFLQVANEIAERGTFASLGRAISFAEVPVVRPGVAIRLRLPKRVYFSRARVETKEPCLDCPVPGPKARLRLG